MTAKHVDTPKPVLTTRTSKGRMVAVEEWKRPLTLKPVREERLGVPTHYPPSQHDGKK